MAYPTPQPFDPSFSGGVSIARFARGTERKQRTRRVYGATVVMMVILGIGTYGYWVLTGGTYSLLDCLYMTVISVCTVGFGEPIDTSVQSIRVFTMLLILFGTGGILYFLSSITASVVEGDLFHQFWQKRMIRRTKALRNHVVVAGLGPTGFRALEELWTARVPVIVLEEDPHRVELAVRQFGEDLLFVIGDVLEEALLYHARTDRALGLIAALENDRENLFLCVSARQINPNLHLIAQVEDSGNVDKFHRIGVDESVNPNARGAHRLAMELTRPGWLAFTDAMLGSEEQRASLACIRLRADSSLVGLPLAKANLRARTGCLIMGLRSGQEEGPFRYHPQENSILSVGIAVIALGTRRQLRSLERLFRSSRRLREVEPEPELQLPGRDEHLIIVGAGTVGKQITEEMQRLGFTHLTVIDQNAEKLAMLRDVRTVAGDALDDRCLEAAGIGEAFGLVTTLGRDKDNLFLCLAARQQNANVRIVSRLEGEANASKFRKVGVDQVISIATMGGRRLAHAILLPELVDFADALIESDERAALLIELPIGANAPVANLRLSAAGLQHRTGCVILGIRNGKRSRYTYRPSQQARLKPGGTVIALGDYVQLRYLGALLDPAPVYEWSQAAV